MSSSLNIFPFENAEGLIRFGAQVTVFLFGLLLANIFVVNPAKKVYLERKKRTSGSTDSAQETREAARKKLQQYQDQINKSRSSLQAELEEKYLTARKASQKLLDEHKKLAEEYLSKAETDMSRQILEAKSTKSKELSEITALVKKHLGIINVSFIIVSLLLSVHPQNVFAVPFEARFLPKNLMQGIFWPYFQFFIFVATLVYFAKKPLESLLERKRSVLRGQLSEAREALEKAHEELSAIKHKLDNASAECEVIRNSQLSIADIECEKMIMEAKKIAEGYLNEARRHANELIEEKRNEIKKELIDQAVKTVYFEIKSYDKKQLDKNLQDEVLQTVSQLKLGL